MKQLLRVHVLLLLLHIRSAVGSEAETPLFGHVLLETGEFLLQYTNFNHGSFGSCPQTVLLHQNELRALQERQPDVWMRDEYKRLINETRHELADYLSTNADNLVLVESASTAVNSILRSMQWRQGDIVMYFSLAYGMVKNTAQWLAATEDIEIVEIPVEMPITTENAFLLPLSNALQDLACQAKLSRLRIVILDHIASVPAVREPIPELAQLVKSVQPHCLVLVDGAHAMGQVRDLNLPRDLGPHIDFYLSNGHKWLYSPKGSAVLWVNSTVINSYFPEPTVISSANSVHDSSFAQRYEYVSTRDYTATISMSKALQFRKVQLGGEDAIHDYVRTLAISAKAHLLKFWQVDALVPDSMEEFMINIGLPKCISSIEQSKALQGWLLQEHNIYMLVLQGFDMFYTRLSAQVYLEMQDFERLGSLVLDFCQDWSITNDHAAGTRIVC